MEKLILIKRYPGAFLESREKIEVPDENTAYKIASEDKECFGYYLKQGRRCVKKVIFGRVYTLEQIKQMSGVEKVLSGMESYKEKAAVKTRLGTWKYMEKGLEVID